MKRLTIASVVASAFASFPQAFPIKVAAIGAANESEKNEMVEKAKVQGKQLLGFVLSSVAMGIGAAFIGFGAGWGLSRGVQYAQRKGIIDADAAKEVHAAVNELEGATPARGQQRARAA